jgi:hypothetical protein
MMQESITPLGIGWILFCCCRRVGRSFKIPGSEIVSLRWPSMNRRCSAKAEMNVAFISPIQQILHQHAHEGIINIEETNARSMTCLIKNENKEGITVISETRDRQSMMSFGPIAVDALSLGNVFFTDRNSRSQNQSYGFVYDCRPLTTTARRFRLHDIAAMSDLA